MAYHETHEYAPFDHQHGYTGVACYPIYTPENCERPYRFMSVKIDDSAGSRTIDLYTPNVIPPEREKPDIGDVRFLARNDITAEYGDISIDGKSLRGVNKTVFESMQNGTFDGWVFPDGSTYPKKIHGYDFSEAYRAFGGQNNWFSVPCISSFFKMNPGIRYSDALAGHEGQTGIKKHNHEIDDADNI